MSHNRKDSEKAIQQLNDFKNQFAARRPYFAMVTQEIADALEAKLGYLPDWITHINGKKRKPDTENSI